MSNLIPLSALMLAVLIIVNLFLLLPIGLAAAISMLVAAVFITIASYLADLVQYKE